MKASKKEQVEIYLNHLMESDRFTIEDLLELTVEDLSEEPTLTGIGKITISTVLTDFKQKYENDFFNEFDDELLAETGGAFTAAPLSDRNAHLSQEEINVLKNMILERANKQNGALVELKLALKNAGIDYMMILKDYRTQKELELKEWEESGKY